MKKKVFYWSPCLSNIGTVKSSINSTIGLNKYFHRKYEVCIINACGEWSKYKKIFLSKDIKIINLSFNYYKFLPKKGFFLSRISYLIIFLISFFPLKRILKHYQPDFVILHMLTSLPIILLFINNFKTKFILRISGFPKLNILRKFLWKKACLKLSAITFPTVLLMDQLKNKRIFTKKIYFLADAILNISEYIKNKNFIEISRNNIKKKYFISVGRLTKQKNFSYLISEFNKFAQTRDNFNLLIFGEGEEEKNLIQLINKYNLGQRVYLMGYSNNIYYYMKNAEALILTSLWEDPGFVLVEAALSNLFIISSDCKNGPTEILLNGKGGLLFNSNEENALYNKLIDFVNFERDKKKLNIVKKNIKKYTVFQHSQALDNILSRI
jgi:glycosyltransferase involved in cell wall biosynthesis